MVTQQYDAIVIGAGVSGLYALYKLRELGLSTRVFEAGSDIGGTWYWNRYPGARFDSESYTYQYSFSQELIDEWKWSEHFSGQPEIERYLHFVANKFDLKRDIECNARVATVIYDEADKRWEIETHNGVRASARYVICATGLLSAHQFPDYQGVHDFAGLSLHSARWPKEPVDFTGKRVGIIGTGPTAVQIIQTIAPDCEQLTVFQRTANWCTPLRNRPITAEEQRALNEKAHEIFALCKRTWAGFIHEPDPRTAMDVPKAERLARYQELYDRGGFALWLGNYSDSFMSQDAADEVAEFLASKIRERVTDPEIAEKLIPKHTFGTKRCPGEKNYYETFNRTNVRLVDLRETPIRRITPTGIACGWIFAANTVDPCRSIGPMGQELTSAFSSRASQTCGPSWGHTIQRCFAISPAASRPTSNGSSIASAICARTVSRPWPPPPKPKTHGPSAAMNRPKDCSSMKCRIHGSSVVPIPRTCVAASCYSLAACRSIARFLPTLLRRDMKASSCASCPLSDGFSRELLATRFEIGGASQSVVSSKSVSSETSRQSSRS